jgi:hypothetical protein
MRKYLSFSFVIVLSVVLIAWGGAGHKTVAKIAEAHLTPNAKTAIKSLLGEQSIVDISSWADEVRNLPEYKHTAPWHYVDLSLGMNYDQFSTAVKAQGLDNVYGAILKCEDDLKSTSTTRQQKVEALKFLVHFVGDSHQPLHVSRTEDKGGNSIQVQFDGKPMNLHSLWDSGLINKEGKTFDQMAKDYDTASPADIKKWQKDVPMQWIYESYLLSTKIYADVEKDNKLGNEYYQKYIPAVNQRIEMGGIRLAGVLNDLFKDGLASSSETTSMASTGNTPINVDAKEMGKYINKTVTTTGQVVSTRLIESNNMTLLNVGGENPNQDFTIMIKSENRSKFGKPEIDLKGKNVTVTGLVIDYRGKPEIELADPLNLKIKN